MAPDSVTADIQPVDPTGSKSMTTFALPMYAVGILVFFLYTCCRVCEIIFKHPREESEYDSIVLGLPAVLKRRKYNNGIPVKTSNGMLKKNKFKYNVNTRIVDDDDDENDDDQYAGRWRLKMTMTMSENGPFCRIGCWLCRVSEIKKAKWSTCRKQSDSRARAKYVIWYTLHWNETWWMHIFLVHYTMDAMKNSLVVHQYHACCEWRQGQANSSGNISIARSTCFDRSANVQDSERIGCCFDESAGNN